MSTRYWAVVPAAGVGRRMAADRPKQYLPLLGRSVIEHTLERLCAHPRIAGVVVAVAEGDRWWGAVRVRGACAPIVAAGGAQRCHSVLNALRALQRRAGEDDWVLVHDAVRPCLRADDVDRLIEAVGDDADGGLLAMPVRETVKRANGDGRVGATVSRESLWRAQTPQMFPLARLREALAGAIARGELVTDEAQAMELAGARPRLVEGHEDNIKITREEDMALAELIIARREAHP